MAIQVVTAIINDEAGRLLVQRRAPFGEFAGCWETPGGKVDEKLDQNEITALMRELREELGLNDAEVIRRPYLRVAFDPPVVARPYDLTFYRVRTQRTPKALEGQPEVAYKHMYEIQGEPWVPSLKMLVAVYAEHERIHLNQERLRAV